MEPTVKAMNKNRIVISRRSFLYTGYALSANAGAREIWLDQDGGWEDVVALAILLQSKNVIVKGVTITPGIATAAVARERTLMLLDALQEKMVRIVDDIPAGADVLATGPLTRVAALIRSRRGPRAVTWMGGALDVEGNAKGGAEWNAFADAGALRTVLASPIPLTICPLDLTNQFPAKADVVSGTGPMLQEIGKAYAEKDRYWWDELAAASIVEPGLFRNEPISLRWASGGRLVRDAKGRAVHVLTRCDRDGFTALLRRVLAF